MKKTSKFLFLCLSLTIIIGVVLGISISATETEENGQIDILAQNVVYGEKVSVAYAVDASVEDAVAGKVKVSYYLATEPSVVYEAELLDTTEPNNLYTVTDDNGTPDDTTDDTKVSYPVFATTGFAPQDFTDVVFAVAYTSDSVPEGASYKEYSVAEYLYAKLYKDGFINKTEADVGADGKDYKRKVHYENMMAYGASAQDLIDGGTETLITDYNYVYVKNGTLADGRSSALYENTTAVALTYNGETVPNGYTLKWKVTDANGASENYESGTSITVDGVAVCEPLVVKLADVITFDGATVGAAEESYGALTNNTSSTTVSLEIANDPTAADGETNEVLKITPTESISENANLLGTVSFGEAGGTGSKYIIEMDVYMAKQSTLNAIDVALMTTDDVNASQIRLYHSAAGVIQIRSGTTRLTESTFATDAWNKFRIEYDFVSESSILVTVYVNGVIAVDAEPVLANSLDEGATVGYIRFRSYEKAFEYYIDNISCWKE